MKKVKSPSPLAPRICACGCGNEFQPGRRDQVYLNSLHADSGYYRFKRKKRDPNSDKLIKLLRGNDSILRFLYEKGKGKTNKIRLSSLIDAGLNTGVCVARMNKDDVIFNCMFNFKYCVQDIEGEKFATIEKLKI